MRKVVFAILAAIAISFFVALGPSWSKPKTIHFVLPDGFAGFFAVVLDQSVKPEVVSKFDLLIVVPDSRVSRVSDVSALRDWHSFTATHANGQILQAFTVEAPTLDSTVEYIKCIGTDETGTTYYVVGSLGDVRSTLANHVPEWLVNAATKKNGLGG